MKAKNVLYSLRYAVRGIIHAARAERNMKIHAAAAFLAVLAAHQLGFTTVEMVLLILTIGLVVVAEMINTAIEAVVNMVSPKFHPLAKIAKDVAAGAVLIAALAACVVAYYLFYLRLFS